MTAIATVTVEGGPWETFCEEHAAAVAFYFESAFVQSQRQASREGVCGKTNEAKGHDTCGSVGLVQASATVNWRGAGFLW